MINHTFIHQVSVTSEISKVFKSVKDNLTFKTIAVHCLSEMCFIVSHIYQPLVM